MMPNSSSGAGGHAPHKFHLDTFVGSEGQVKYTNKTAQSATRGAAAHQQQQHQHMQHQMMLGAGGNNANMDSLEPDSVQ